MLGVFIPAYLLTGRKKPPIDRRLLDKLLLQSTVRHSSGAGGQTQEAHGLLENLLYLFDLRNLLFKQSLNTVFQSQGRHGTAGASPG